MTKLTRIFVALGLLPARRLLPAGSLLLALLLLPAGLFAATITGTVSTGGTGGTPIADAKVVLIATGGGGGGGGGTRLDSVTTNAEGKYTFTLDTTGNRQIQASATGYTTGTGNVNVASDTVAYTVNITLVSTAPGKVEGKVVSDTTAGTPIVGATVILRRTTGGGGGGGTVFTPDTVLTDAEGKYAFDSIPGNTGYTLAVSMTGFTTVTRNNITIPGGQTATQNFNLVPPPAPGSITGKVVKTGDSSALAGARVILSRQGGGGGGFTPDTVLTNEQGVYTLPEVPANTNYTLTVSLTGYSTSTRNGVNVTAGQAATQNFTLAPPIPPGSIGGKVTKASDGSALADARVILSRTGGGGGGGGGFQADTVLTNAQGEFAYDTVPNQTNYILTVSAAGFSTTVNNNVDVAGGLKSTVNFALDAVAAGDTTGTIKGVVSNAATGAHTTGAVVILTRLTGGGGGGAGGGTALDTVTTDSTGAFNFPDLAAGNYRLNVTATGLQATQTGTLALVASGTFLANIDLTAPVSLRASAGRSSPGRSYWMAGRMVIELDPSKRAQAISVFGADGKLLHRIRVEPGTTRLTLPSDIRPGMKAALRVEY